LDADFRPDSLQMDALARVKDPVLPADPEFMKSAALAIAAPYDFARVDFFVGADGTLYLGEITFSPSNALSRRPAAMEQRLGALLRFDPA
jgi:D-alanine-D-alanine ligase-like ATP-grasp enzyme